LKICYVKIIYVLFIEIALIEFIAFIALIAFVKFNASHWKWDLLCRSGIEYRKAVLEVIRLCDWNL